jgi:hypothetical protein
MRKLIVSNAMSLDGYYEGPGNNVMALFDYRWVYPTDESFDAYNAERLRAADTLLLDEFHTMGSRVSGRPWQMIPTPRLSNGRYHGSTTP